MRDQEAHHLATAIEKLAVAIVKGPKRPDVTDQDVLGRLGVLQDTVEKIMELLPTSGGGGDPAILARIEAAVNEVRQQGVVMAGELDALKAEVAETNGVIDSAIVLINGIAARIQEVVDAGGKPADFEALRAELDAKSSALAAAVAANTPPTP